MTGIIPGEPNGSNDVMNAFGSNFNDTAQTIFQQDYFGFDNRLTNSGTPNLKNVFYSTFTSDDSDVLDIFVYDEVNDLYKTYDASGIGTNYVIIEADDDTISWTNNDTQLDKIGTGKWILFGTSGTDEVIRANIHKSLFYGTSGSNPLVLGFNNVTSLKTTVTRDVGKRAHFASMVKLSSISPPFTYDGVFSNTTTNNDCSSWSFLFNQADFGTRQTFWEIPDGTIRNQLLTDGTSDEFGTDRTADEVNNPADCQLIVNDTTNNDNTIRVVVLCEGNITWTENGSDPDLVYFNRNFFIDNSIPDFTASTEDFLNSTLIFKNTTSSTVTNATTAINSQIDATSSEQISVAFDGSTFTDVNNTEIVRATPTGTALWRKIVITRTDISKEDKVTEQAIKHNYY